MIVNKRKTIKFGILFALLVFIYTLKLQNPAKNNLVEDTTNNLKILIYTSHFGEMPWYRVPYDYKFTENNGEACFQNKCSLTYNKKELQSSDVVIFHGSDLPPVNILWILRKASSKNVWLWYFLESPFLQKVVTKEYDGLFNLTASYSTKSDIHVPYYTFKKYTETNSTRLQTLKNHNFAENKDKMILFINSNCDFRLDLVKKLKEHVEIDVYGHCKKHVKQTLTGGASCKKNSAECEKLQTRYKFYLAVENSFCEDYVTEKYYSQSLLKGLVPIMMGPITYSDSRLIVPNSFIDMRKFKDIKHLADYLKYLDSNDTAYNEYFAWQQEYRFVDANVMCKFCQGLWTAKENLKVTSSGVKLSEFFGIETKCKNIKKYLSRYL